MDAVSQMERQTVTHALAAKKLGVATRTIERMLRDGRLKAIPDRERLLVDAVDLELVLRDRRLLRKRRRPRAAAPLGIETKTREAPPLATPALGSVETVSELLPCGGIPKLSMSSVTSSGPPTGITPLSLEPDPPLPATGAPLARRARRSRPRQSVAAVATALVLAALAVWLITPDGSPRPQASGKPATQHHETHAPTVLTGSTRPPATPTAGGRVEPPSLSPTSRGGLATLVTPISRTRLAPVSRTNAVLPSATTPPGHSPAKPSSSSANCGFGSLTYGGC